MKKLASTCRIVAASLLVSSGLLAAVAVEPADAIRVRRRGFSTDQGSFDVDYEIDYTDVDDSGVPNAGTLTALDITLNDVIFDANFQSLNFDSSAIDPFRLLAEDAQASISFNDGCSIELCNSSVDVPLLIGSASDFSDFTASEIESGLIETWYIISFFGEFSDEVPIDQNGIEGITPAQKEEGVDGFVEIFFSQPDETVESIFSFGSLTYTSALPDFISVNVNSDGVTFPDLDPLEAPSSTVDNPEPTDVPEPSMAAGLLALGAAYGMRKRAKPSA